MKRFATHLVAGVCAAVVLAACGGGDSPRVVGNADAKAVINASTGATLVPALSGQAMSFSGGVAELGTAGTATEVKFTAGATPSFSILAGGNSATGDLGFGSCKFTIKTSTFAPGHALSVGATITVEPCEINIATANQVATGNPIDTDVTLVLGATKSLPKKLPVTISSSGAVTIVTPSGTAVPLGTISLTTVTGAS